MIIKKISGSNSSNNLNKEKMKLLNNLDQLKMAHNFHSSVNTYLK